MPRLWPIWAGFAILVVLAGAAAAESIQSQAAQAAVMENDDPDWEESIYESVPVPTESARPENGDEMESAEVTDEGEETIEPSVGDSGDWDDGAGDQSFFEEEQDDEAFPGTPEHPLAGRWMIGLQGGYAGYTMTDLNQVLDNDNQVYAYYRLPATNPLNGGAAFGGQASYWLTHEIALGLEIGWLRAESVGGTNELGRTFRVSALETGGFFKAGARVTERLTVSGGLGLYYLNLAGATYEIKQSRLGLPEETYSLSGSAVSIKLFGGMDYRVTPYAGVCLDVGYRLGHMAEVKASRNGTDYILVMSAGDRFTLDYSGLYLQGGICFYVQ